MMHFIFHPISIFPDLKAFQFTLEKMTLLFCIPNASQFYQQTLPSLYLHFLPFKLPLKSCIVLIPAEAQTIHTNTFVTA